MIKSYLIVKLVRDRISDAAGMILPPRSAPTGR